MRSLIRSLVYDFKTGCVKTECLHEGWQTSGSLKVVRMAFNLYRNGTPSVLDYDDAEEQVDECRRYTVEELFCCAYAPYFWQAVQIRYACIAHTVKERVELPPLRVLLRRRFQKELVYGYIVAEHKLKKNL